MNEIIDVSNRLVMSYYPKSSTIQIILSNQVREGKKGGKERKDSVAKMG